MFVKQSNADLTGGKGCGNLLACAQGAGSAPGGPLKGDSDRDLFVKQANPDLTGGKACGSLLACAQGVKLTLGGAFKVRSEAELG